MEIPNKDLRRQEPELPPELPEGSVIIDNPVPTPEEIKIETPGGFRLSLSSTTVKVDDLLALALGTINKLEGVSPKKEKDPSRYHG